MKKNMIHALTLFFLFVSVNLSGADLHCIIIADTQAQGISPSVKADLTNVKEQVTKVAFHTGLDVKELIFQGDAVNQNVLSTLEEYPINPDDVVILFFAGHGFRTDTKAENPWPNLFFTPINQGIDYSDIFQILLNKEPRFMLSIADCCNNVINEKYAPSVLKKREFIRFFNPNTTENYCRLFLESSGFVIASSSSPGQFAWGGSKGGLFTLAFFKSLEEEVQMGFPSDWRVILERASLEVYTKKRSQIPQYEINVN